MIQVSELVKTYRNDSIDLMVLKGISLSIERGEFVAIMGPSGSGKSTLLNILGCLDAVEGGQYRFNDTDISNASDDALALIRRNYIGFVFQLFNLIPRINALRNVELPLIYAQVPRAERMQRAREALDLVGLGERVFHAPSQLSGGQQQRVAIARALVNDPDVIIADEPTGSLDTENAREVMDILALLNKSGKTIILVTHEEHIAEYANRTIRVRDGKLVDGH